jgi:signal peptidase II
MIWRFNTLIFAALKFFPVKGRYVAGVVLLIILADQVLKFYIKTSYTIGEEHQLIGSWFRLHFVENEGMAWGLKWGGDFGKLALTLFRLVAVIFGTFLIRRFIRKKYHNGFIICSALIYAGALGNLLDSMFYGLIFNESTFFSVATLFPPEGGYTSFLHGKVVDMLYFPIVQSTFPDWFPVWGGEPFEFFSPVFNLADASISCGVMTLLLFQNRFFPEKTAESAQTIVTDAPVDDKSQML